MSTPTLSTAIATEVAGLPQMGQPLSRRWIAVRDAVLAKAANQPQMPYQSYLDLCEREGVTGDEVPALVNLLHDLGQVIYYGDDAGLSDIIVLDPEWLTKAISYVLEDRPTREAGGVLDHRRLRQIWSERDGERYPPAYHPYFLRLMEKFDVSYRLADDEHRSLVAQLVPDEEPELPWDFETPLAADIRSITLVCGLGEPAPGLIAWLTVRHHNSTTGRHWSTGVFLRHPNGAYNSEALLRAAPDGQIALQVRAPAPDLFFNVLLDSLENLIRLRWPGLRYTLYVPCPAPRADETVCGGQLPLDGLIRYRQRGGTTHTCLHCQTDHDVSRLLTGFAAPTLSTLEAGLRDLHDEVRQRTESILQEVHKGQQYAALSADLVRRVLKATAAEVTDCPRLFTLTPRHATGVGRLLPFQHHYRLTLWCEHPGHWHPWSAAWYDVQAPRKWLAAIAPYADLVLRTLKLAVPIAASAAGVLLPEQDFKAAANYIDLMKTIVDKASGTVDDERPDLELRPPTQLSPAEGQALRGLRALLFEHDRLRSFGDLRRVQAPSGELLWVCPTHRPVYDPGLPTIPDRTDLAGPAA